jgi:predicted ATPase/class 3 adenylate cyclase/DNA-binding SARP family transcriptional activator
MVQDDEGRDLTPPGARERDGLVTLAVVSPDPLSTERLAAELYQERSTSDPRNAVQAMVSRLRRSLGRSAGSIETTTNGYRLVDTTLDLDEAEQLLTASIAEPDPTPAAALLEQALELWNGPTLDGMSGELIDNERQRLDALRADAEDAVLERRLGGGIEQNLVGALEAAVRDEPFREKRWELLMRALYLDGRQAEALRAFQRARSLLSNHLGLEPGPALSRLEQQILSHDPALGSNDDARDGGSSQPSPPPKPDPPPSLPRGTVTVLMCDVVGSVGRWEAAPTDTARDIEQLHRIWAEATDANGGHLVKSTGDGVLSVFSTAGSAVVAAAAALRRHQDGSLQVRVAANTGPLEPVDGDYRGPVVNRCARLLDLASGGQILVSGTTADLAALELRATSDLPPADSAAEATPTLRQLGSHRLRDVPEPIAIWQIEGPGLRSSFPPLASDAAIPVPRLRNTLLGRAALQTEIQASVQDEKLVTLLGPGGIGKTSLAVAVAWEVAGGRPLHFVDLARVTDPAAVEHRLAEAIVSSDHDEERDPIDRIADRLRGNTDLVVIDNAEHVLDAVADVLDRLLVNELKASFLVTSRQPLGLADEFIVGVPPLELPTASDDLSATGRSPSVQLFLERARTVRPDFEVPSGLLPVVAHICRRLDGVPLAIELAAGRASLLSVDDIASMLDDQLRLLRQVRSNRDRRHRSLEAVVGWSVEQLTPGARETFNRLSVMAGGFGLDGAEALLERCGLGSIDVLDALDELHGASLLAVDPEGSRFRMLEPIRQTAAAELAGRGLETETRQAHARWLTDLIRGAHGLRDESRAPAYARIDENADQVIAAITWIADAEQRELAGQIAFESAWWFLTRDARTGDRLLGRLLSITDRSVDPLGWANVVLGLGIATAAHPWSDVADITHDAIEEFDRANHPDRGVARLAAAFAVTDKSDPTLPLSFLEQADRLTSSDDRWASALIDMTTMTMQSLVLMFDPDLVDPEPMIERGQRAIATFRDLDETWALGATLGELGRLQQSVGRLDEAEACYLESLELFSGADYHGSHYVYSELGRLASRRGDHVLAEQYHREAKKLAQIDGSAGCLAMALAGMGDSAEAAGDAAAALDLYRTAAELSDQATLIEHGHQSWNEALERLEAVIGSQRDGS